jgi:hypothetical protein
MIDQLDAVARAVAQPGQPDTAFRALDRAMGQAIGHKLFTIMLFHAASGESERCYTNQPQAYPVGGRKPLNETFWTQQVLRDLRPYIGRDYNDIRAVFFDHELIRSLGCESILNLPVAHDGTPLGTINMLHQAGWYGDHHLALGRIFAQLAAPVLMRLQVR